MRHRCKRGRERTLLPLPSPTPTSASRPARPSSPSKLSRSLREGDAPGGADVAGVTAELASADVGEAVVRVGSGDTTSVSAGDPVAEETVPAEPAGQATAVESIVESAAVAVAPSVESGSGRTTRATARATVGQIAGLSGDAAAVKYITAEFAIQRPKALVSGPLSVVVALPRLMPWCVGRPNHAASGSTCSPRREPC